MDTIFALSTAQGRAGIAVIRISGPRSMEALAALTQDVPPPRLASVRILRSRTGVILDEALVVVFEKGQSFTGEQSVEIQCHGSPAVVSAILKELGLIDGLRYAEVGEFTRVALENGRLDLAQVEGLADLLEAETEAQRLQAFRVFGGELGRQTEFWRRDLIRATALVEATIDFADEEVPVDVSPEVTALLVKTKADLERQIAGAEVAERIRSGFEVAIVGAPNVGKSTLLNALAGREAAIVSEYAGTTRDVIEVRMDLGGLPVTFLDTAGIRETSDPIESIGIARAVDRAKQADLRVYLIEAGSTAEITLGEDDVVLRCKADLLSSGSDGVSGRTGQGVTELVERITAILSKRGSFAGIATRYRHKIAMERAVASLDAAQASLSRGELSVDIAAEELRASIRALDSLVGRVDVESVLDEIFKSFCLGK